MNRSEAELRAVARGFAGLSVAEEHKQTALENLRRWLVEPPFEAYRAQLEWLIASERWAALLDSFYRVLPFGTGGRRGPVGIGTNRYNAYTLATSVQGHVAYLRERHPGEDPCVVIVYDVRVFHDLRGVYGDPPNPLLGMSSRDFARVAAEVYAANGVRVFLPAEERADYVSTPELSFAIRRLEATAGLNISASHNHPDDNGGKFYNRHGGQEVPPHDEDMAKRVEDVDSVTQLPLERAVEAGLVGRIPDEIHEAYIDLNVAQSLHPEARGARIVLTPLHGSGDSSAGAALRRAGFAVELVQEQSTPDGRFPAVRFRAPNPEVPESMEEGIALARRLEADLVMACDPDADRIGVCARTPDGEYRFLTGNQISVLVTHYKLEQLEKLGRLPEHPLVIKTEVTTELLRPITERFGGTLMGDLLVGFKYHGHILERLEGPSAPAGLRLADFIVGAEESHGILVTPEIRDKDAAGAAILLAELASLLKGEGRTLVDYLDQLYERYGYHGNLLSSMVMTGAEGLRDIKAIQRSLREDPPRQIGRFPVTAVVDHLDENGPRGRILSGTDAASRDMIVFRFESGASLAVRPSGTEPKNKVYIEVPAPALSEGAGGAELARQKRETDAVARELASAFTRQMLSIIGVDLPDYALLISGLVSLDKRIDFAERFVPGLEAQLEALAGDSTSEERVSVWIDEQLADYGKDARGLVDDALVEYVRTRRLAIPDPGSEDGRARSSRLDAMERIFFGSTRLDP